MNPVVFHLISGDAIYSACVLILVAIILSIAAASKMFSRLRIALIVLGCLVISLTSTPVPIIQACAFAVLTILTWKTSASQSGKRSKSFVAMVFINFVVVASFAAVEFRYSFPSAPKRAPAKRVLIVGDSLSAGLNEPEELKWPSLIAADHAIEVVNYSKVGATASSMARRLSDKTLPLGLVLIEIGGNDVLNNGTVIQFEKGLRELLQIVVRQQRVAIEAENHSSNPSIAMFELPLPPLHWRFASVQRGLAKEFDVLLIPKRTLLSVLSQAENTSDTLHLSLAGNRAMADEIWPIISPAFDANTNIAND